MPPRIKLRSPRLSPAQPSTYICLNCRHASIAAAHGATAPAPPSQQAVAPIEPTFRRYNPVQPPSHRSPTLRKSQLLRQYVSLLHTTPLIILFQHNNLRALEWASIRRELATALSRIDSSLPDSHPDRIADSIKLTVIRTNIFEVGLRIAEYYRPASVTPDLTNPDPEPTTVASEALDPSLTHALSEAAYQEAALHHNEHALSPLLTGSLAALTFPTVSPEHVKAALSILSPVPGQFPAPTRRLAPGYHEPPVQDGVKKLSLLGARIEGRVFDGEGVRWVGGIQGGMDGLRASLVGMLGGVAGGITRSLEAGMQNLYFTVEGRRRMLEEEEKPGEAQVEDVKV